MIDALRIIVAKSPYAASQAVQCIAAIKAKSPVLQQRYNRVVEMAFSDPQAEAFTPEDRQLIAEYVTGEGGEGSAKLLDVRVRVNASEKAEVQRLAADASLTISDYIRSRIF